MRKSDICKAKQCFEYGLSGGPYGSNFEAGRLFRIPEYMFESPSESDSDAEFEL